MDSDSHDDASLSIIPYDTNREVVLRHQNSIVVFDPESRQLILRSRERGLDARATLETACPHCGRVYDEGPSSAVEDDIPEEQQPSFIDRGYFRLLAKSSPSSRQNSVSPPSRRRLPQSVPSLAAAVPVPSGNAEFLGSEPAPPNDTYGISESAFSPRYFEKFFVVEKELGRGGKGVVLLVKHVLDNVSLGRFACKRVPVGDDHGWLEKVLVEVQTLQALSHQNLVSYRHVWLEDYKINTFSPSVPCAFILQQYCNGGDLHTYVCASAQVRTTTQELKERLRRRSRGEAEAPRKLKEPRKLDQDQIYDFFSDITEGLRFLHMHGYVHRDLKPSNCLLHRVGNETRVLVSDFGEVQYEDAIRKSTGATGTISYCAPEVLKPVSPGGPLGNFTVKSDIFSLGMILHFLCFANLPYRSADVLNEDQENLEELRSEIMGWSGFDDNFRIRPELPWVLYHYLRKLLAIFPDERPNSDEVLHHIRMAKNGIPEFKRRASMEPEELTPGKRITKVDSPATGNSNKSQRPKDIDTISPTRQLRKIGPMSPILTERRLSSSEADGYQTGSNDHQEDRSELTSMAMTRSSSHGTYDQYPGNTHNHDQSYSTSPDHNPADSSISPQPRSPTRRPLLLESPKERNSQSLERKRPQLLLESSEPLTPLGPSTMMHKLRYWLVQRVYASSFYILLFTAKILSVIQPCLSTGINVTLFYAVFALATVELATQPHPVWRVALLLSLHGAVLWFAHDRDMWCRTRIEWELE